VEWLKVKVLSSSPNTGGEKKSLNEGQAVQGREVKTDILQSLVFVSHLYFQY
jgi:hypothetical protein